MAIDNHDASTTPAVTTPAGPGSVDSAWDQKDLLQWRDVLWAEFLEARRELAEVMSDEELAELGFNLAVLDEAP